ncbi:MAG TPA: biotin transporter BioY [Actinomycetota bacterium]|jgi:biotin transport system substrate-specific component|nr:biotin transporter BioY [Actinomycetota bacterium]
MSASPLAIAASPARIRSETWYRALLALGGSWLVAALAQLEVHLPSTPVPVTGQTIGVLIVGAALGSWLGAISLLLYLAQGALGMPVYSGGDAGVGFLGLSSATGGYLWGFVIAAAIVGRLSEAGFDRSVPTSLAAMLVGELVIYAVGVPWLMIALDVSSATALRLGVLPFVVGDALKLVVAGAAMPAAWKLKPLADRR